MTEQDWEQKLNIRTTGRDDKHADQFHHPYEPTPYCVLERLLESGFINANNTLVDYGCGKGRVGFFLAHMTGCRCIGLEYDPPIFNQAEENLASFLSRNDAAKLPVRRQAGNLSPGNQNPGTHLDGRQQSGTGFVSFLCQTAETYEIADADCFYFFNPFTVEILRSVMQQIIGSYYENPRTMRLFFYYPDPEYVSYLLAGDSTGMLNELYFLEELDCRDLFEGDDAREKIMIFELTP